MALCGCPVGHYLNRPRDVAQPDIAHSHIGQPRGSPTSSQRPQFGIVGFCNGSNTVWYVGHAKAYEASLAAGGVLSGEHGFGGEKQPKGSRTRALFDGEDIPFSRAQILGEIWVATRR